MAETPEKSESRVKLGSFSHVGIVVRDVEKAKEYYSSVFGFGPFETDVYELKGFLYRGQPADARVKAAFAYHGPMLIELVEVLEGETPHTEFLREKGEGLQHVAFRVKNLSGILAELAKEGIEPIMQYTLPMEIPADLSGGKPDNTRKRLFDINEVYLNSDKVGGTVIQLMEFKEHSSA